MPLRVRWRGLALLGFALPAGAPSAWAQGTVLEARFAADLDGSAGGAVVRVEYRLGGVAPGDSVPLTVLDFGAATALDVRSGAGGGPIPLAVRQGAARGGWARAEGAPDGGVRVVTTYRVTLPAAGPPVVVAHLPVLRVDLPFEGARPGLFRGELRLPPVWRVLEAFPTGLAPGGEAGSWAGELQVVPSVVTLRFSPGGGWKPGLPVLLNVLTAAALVLVSVAGWRQLTGRPA